MPATFAHLLMAQEAIDRIQRQLKTNAPRGGNALEYAQKMGENNNFVITGAAGPDYPYLTEILTTSILHISHTWADRMHYENTLSFVKEGVKQLVDMNRKDEEFYIKLSWFCGFVSHAVADSFVHPVINSIVHGIYMFTHKEHAKCELIQDVYIFQKETGEDIVMANPRGGSVGYLNILEECSDPEDEHKNRIHPQICDFWKDLLMAAHPYADEYFRDINPDRWHYNYKGRVSFVADPGPISRHILGLTGLEYMKASDIPAEDKKKYITKITLPNGDTSTYDTVFDKTIDLIVTTWLQIFICIDNIIPDNVNYFIKDWNLDTGVDESQIDLWLKEEV